MTTILSDNFNTPLGTIRTWVETEINSQVQQPDNCRLTTTGHNICMQVFNVSEISSPGTVKYETAKGWRWFIQKRNNKKEQLTIFCTLINPSGETTWGANPGEHLDSIEIENKTHHLHIGTEDGEMMQYRAEVSDWMPKRFEDEIGFYKSFTEYIDFGFKTIIPELENGEEIYFHFIVATNTIKPSKDYPNERDVSTWLAVEQSKRHLDEKLKKYCM